MYALLSDMFHRGHPADIAFFVIGGWLLSLFVVMMVVQIIRRFRDKGSARKEKP